MSPEGRKRVRFGVVIGVVVIVTTAFIMFISAIGRARSLAMRASCGANLRTIASGIGMYSSQNNDRLPFSGPTFAGSWLSDIDGEGNTE